MPKGDDMTAIRAARAEDAAELARLTEQWGHPTSTDDMTARLAVLLPRPEHFIVVADGDPGMLRGWAAAERRLSLGSGDGIELVGLVVDAAARRTGVGRSLVDAVERWAAGQGASAVLLRSNVARVESHPFYERIGYMRRKTQHAYHKPLPAN